MATRLYGAKVFTKLDVRNGFWHVVLDDESSFLTTFNTPFGRYRWLRMPFGIRSAPEVFQWKMHELIEGIPNIEVVGDDFVIVGYGTTKEEATKDHDKNLCAFLQHCESKGLKLNIDKLQLRKTEAITGGWHAKRLDVRPCLYPYFDIRDELTVQGELIFKGQQLHLFQVEFRNIQRDFRPFQMIFRFVMWISDISKW